MVLLRHKNIDAQSWAALFRAFSSFQQPSAYLNLGNTFGLDMLRAADRARSWIQRCPALCINDSSCLRLQGLWLILPSNCQPKQGCRNVKRARGGSFFKGHFQYCTHSHYHQYCRNTVKQLNTSPKPKYSVRRINSKK